MSGESSEIPSEIPIEASSKETIRGMTYERTPFPTEGRFVKSFLEAHPEVISSRDLWPDLIEANKGRAEVTMLFPGYKEAHTKSIMRGRTVHSLVEELDDTVGFIDWMNTTHIEELVARGLADHFEASGYQSIKMFGASHGGYFALRLASYFKRFEKEGFNIPVESLIVAVAPATRECFKARMPLDPELAMGAGYLVLDRFHRKVTGRHLYVPGFIRRPRADVLRILAVSKRPFTRGDFPEGLVVHYFATDAEQGKIDKLVNQPLAISQLRDAGLEVVVHNYKPGALGHVIHSNDIPRMNEDLLKIFSASDKIKPDKKE